MGKVVFLGVEGAGKSVLGEFGIQYLSADYLVDDLIENEPEIFSA